jgi:hypothetical protein
VNGIGAKPAWTVRGDYFESCSCDYVCPCLASNLTATPTKGDCVFAFAFRVDQGRFGTVPLDGLCFAMVGMTPGAMVQGNWKVGLVVDERANADQEQAIAAIATGQAGGPMSALGPLIASFLGVEKRPIRFEKTGLRRAVTIPGVLDQAVEGVASAGNPNEPIVIDNTMHPVNPRVALAHATQSRISAFGLSWSDSSGRNNGHFAPFSWQGAAST